jgi:acetolactate synthase-1/3 small subunit
MFRANVVDVARESLVLEITGTRDKIDAFFNMIEPYGILEFIRSGDTGLQRGANVLSY